MNDLARLDPAFQRALDKEGAEQETLVPGSAWVNKRGKVMWIDRLEVGPPQREAVKGEVVIHVHCFYEFDGEKYPSGAIPLRRFLDTYLPLRMSLEEAETLALKAMQDPESVGLATPDAEIAPSTSTSLLQRGPEQVYDLQRRAMQQMERAQVYERLVQRRVDELAQIAHAFQEQLVKINKVLGALHLYLGTDVEIVQIRVGKAAPAEAPITFFQAVRYLDEEVGDTGFHHGVEGLDWQSIEDFDTFLVEEANLNHLLPNPKSVVALRPSRQERHYSDNPWANIWANAKNKDVYVIVRNGDRVYRIFTPLSLPGNKLYPAQDELAQRLAEAQEAHGHFEEERIREVQFGYKKTLLLFQGLLDHTKVFHPLPHPINLFDGETWGGIIGFAYDAELAFAPAGRLPYREWKRKINAQITVGSRIVVALNNPGRQVGGARDRKNRYRRYYQDDMSVPPRALGRSVCGGRGRATDTMGLSREIGHPV